MFPILFRKFYMKAKMRIEAENHMRIAQETPSGGVSCMEYVYVDDGEQMHKMNLYKPESCLNTENIPFVIDIHGGGWICGDKDTNNKFCSYLASEDNVVAAPSYRTIDCCTLREQIEDIFNFFHWIESHHKRYKICIDQTFLAGDSAGAQLALLAYCVNQSGELQSLFSVKRVNFSIRGLILNHGVCYLKEAANLPTRKLLSRYFLNPGLQEMLYGKDYLNTSLYLHTADPVDYVLPQAKLPPVFLITSKGDHIFSYQTLRLYHELKQWGKRCELYFEENPDAEHVFNIAYPDSETGKKCNQAILHFIRSCYKYDSI